MAGRCYGATDVETVLSHGEAARLALSSLVALEGRTLAFDALWSSDLVRCRGLGEALAPSLAPSLAPGVDHRPDCGLSGSLEVRVDVRLRELDHGTFERRAWDEIHGSEPQALKRWGASWQSEGPPQGESATALESRVRDWHAELDDAQRHLLVGHAGVMRALLVVSQGLDWPAAMSTEIPHLRAIRLA